MTMPAADYFGALMRSGGLLQPARSRAAERTAVGLQERVAQTPAARPTSAGFDRPAVQPLVIETQTVTPAAARPPEANAAVPAVVSATDPVHLSERVEQASAPEPLGPQTDLDPARSVVRTVMQWIAADPNTRPSGAVSRVAAATATTPAPIDRTPPALPRIITPSRQVDARPTGTRDRDDTARPVQVLPRAAEQIETQTDIAGPAPRFATLAARPAAIDPAAAEPLTVTIGAIHLRVDAPAVHTMAPPAAPAARPLPERSPQRSGLSRRALRRI